MESCAQKSGLAGRNKRADMPVASEGDSKRFGNCRGKSVGADFADARLG